MSMPVEVTDTHNISNISAHDDNASDTRVVRRGPGMMGGNDKKNRMDTQYKYAAFAKAAYSPGKKKVASELFKTEPGMSDFELDPDVSTQSVSVFHNPVTGETVVACRGTNNVYDVATDIVLANVIIDEKNSTRFEATDRTIRSALEKYGTDNVAITGHSLAGDEALYFGRKYDIPSYGFNPGISVQRAWDTTSQKYKDNVNKATIYATMLDPVSKFGQLLMGDDTNTELIMIDQTEYWDSHTLDNFMRKHAHHKFTTESVAKSAQQLDNMMLTSEKNIAMGAVHGVEEAAQLAWHGAEKVAQLAWHEAQDAAYDVLDEMAGPEMATVAFLEQTLLAGFDPGDPDQSFDDFHSPPALPPSVPMV
jgi:hypothetical protein